MRAQPLIFGGGGGGYVRPPRPPSFMDYVFSGAGRNSDDDTSLAIAILSMLMRQQEAGEMRRQFDVLQQTGERRYKDEQVQSAKMLEDLLSTNAARRGLEGKRFELLESQYEDLRDQMARQTVETNRLRAGGIINEQLATELAKIQAEKELAPQLEQMRREQLAGVVERTVGSQVADLPPVTTYANTPKTVDEYIGINHKIMDRFRTAKTDKERAEIANAALPTINDAIARLDTTGLDITPPYYDINPWTWISRGVGALGGTDASLNKQEAEMEKYLRGMLTQNRFLLGKYADPSLQTKSEIEARMKAGEKAAKLAEAKATLQSELSKASATTRPADVQAFEATIPARVQELMRPPAPAGAPAPQMVGPTSRPSPAALAPDDTFNDEEQLAYLLSQMGGGQ